MTGRGLLIAGAVALGLALQTGQATGADDDVLPAPVLPPAEKPTGTGTAAPVPTQAPKAPGRLTEPVRAQLKPARRTVLAAGIAARVTQLPVEIGDRVAAGDTLAAFDCRETRARRRQARARLDGARSKLNIYEELDSLQSISGLEMTETRTEVALAEAELEGIEARLAKCRMAAPFAADVVRREVQPHQYVAEGTPMVALVDNASLRMEAVVDSRWLAWLRPGVRFTLRVDELGRDLAGAVARIGARVDPVSQTVRVVGTLDAGSGNLLAGMSGDVRFHRPDISG